MKKELFCRVKEFNVQKVIKPVVSKLSTPLQRRGERGERTWSHFVRAICRMFTKGFTPMKVNDFITKFISASQNLHWVFRCSFRPAARAPLRACSLIKKLKWKNVVIEGKTWVVSVVSGSRLWIKMVVVVNKMKEKKGRLLQWNILFLLIIVENYYDRLKPIQIPLS